MLVLNGQELKLVIFPNGETKLDGHQIKEIAKEENVITMRFESDADFLHLLFLKNHLDDILRVTSTKLILPYIPYSRMDRTEGTGVFTLKSVAKLINNMNFDSVEVFEAHSEVSLALIDRVQAHMMTSIGMIDDVKKEIGFDETKDFIFYPDAGAEKRYQSSIKGKHLFGIKHRDFETGRIKSLEIAGKVTDTDVFDKVLIVDDLSSYGGTFHSGAMALKEKFGFKEIYLVVGHAENNIVKGKIPTEGLIQKVFTTDSIYTEEHPIIKSYPHFFPEQ